MLLDISSENTEALIQRDTCTPVFIAALFPIAKIKKQPKCPMINKQIRRSGIYIHIYTHTQWNSTQP